MKPPWSTLFAEDSGRDDANRLVTVVADELPACREGEPTESQLRDSEERLRLAVDVAQMGTWDWDMVRNQVAWSQKLYEIVGLTPEAYDGTFAACMALVYPDDRASVEQAIARAIETDLPFAVVCRFVRGDGQVRWSETRGQLYRARDGRPVRMIGVMRDVTERRLAEQQLREAHERLHALSQRLLEVQESERRHIARELHDEIGQTLTAGIINLQIVLRAAETAARQPELLESVALLEGALQQVRNMSLDLRPSLLDDLGLLPALRWYLNRQAQRASFAVELRGSLRNPSPPPLSPAREREAPAARLPAELETVCFRVVQEAITNIVRHARARKVSVDLHVDAQEVQMWIGDDGVGFDVAAARRRANRGESLGLLSMQERVLLVGGRLTVTSAKGQGTTIQATVPIHPVAARATPAVEA